MNNKINGTRSRKLSIEMKDNIVSKDMTETGAMSKFLAMFENDSDSLIGKNKNGKKANYISYLNRLITLFWHCDISINGLKPGQGDILAEYLMHGGRIKIDMSGLYDNQKQNLRKFLLPEGALYPRMAATHGSEKLSDGKTTIEIKQNGIKSLTFKKSKSVHFGLNLAIGGKNNIHTNKHGDIKTITANGQYGHLYVYNKPKSDIMLFGIESAEANQTNAMTGGTHSLMATSNKTSAFGLKKLNEMYKDNLSDFCHSDTWKQCPLSVQNIDFIDKNAAKYDWCCVKVTAENLQKCKQELEEGKLTNNETMARLQKSHPQAEEVDKPKTRYQKMLENVNDRDKRKWVDKMFKKYKKRRQSWWYHRDDHFYGDLEDELTQLVKLDDVVTMEDDDTTMAIENVCKRLEITMKNKHIKKVHSFILQNKINNAGGFYNFLLKINNDHCLTDRQIKILAKTKKETIVEIIKKVLDPDNKDHVELVKSIFTKRSSNISKIFYTKRGRCETSHDAGQLAKVLDFCSKDPSWCKPFSETLKQYHGHQALTSCGLFSNTTTKSLSPELYRSPSIICGF